SYDRTARLWDVATGKPLGPPLRHAEKIQAVAFSPDGATVLTGSQDGYIRRWNVPGTAEGPPGRVVLWVQGITGMQLDRADLVEPMDFQGWDQCRQQLEEQASSHRP